MIYFIIIVGGIVVFFIYSSFPETKFNKALLLLKNGKRNEALSAFKVIINDHDNAGLKIAEIYLENARKLKENGEEEKAIDFVNQILNVRSKISSSTAKQGLAPVELNAQIELAEIYLQKAKKENLDNEAIEWIDKLKNICSKEGQNNSKLRSLKTKGNTELSKIYLRQANNKKQEGRNDSAITLYEKAIKYSGSSLTKEKEASLKSLANIHNNRGITCEKKCQYNACINEYTTSINFLSQLRSTTIQYYNILSRIEISKLKKGKEPDFKKIKESLKGSSQFKDDLTYRVALYYAKRGEISRCEKTIEKYLKTKRTKHILNLKFYCEEYYISKSIEAVSRINNYVAKEGDEDTLSLYNSMDSLMKSIRKGFPHLEQRAIDFKTYLFSKLVGKYFEEGNFERVIKVITQYPSFYENPKLLNNIGIACLRLVNDNKVSNSNYKNLISIWLTAVYSDKVILDSLETTSWDDDYTFSLIDSIGSHYMFEHDVENVNFEDVSSTNISIGDTQKELIVFFENGFNNITDLDLQQNMFIFYNLEKEALEKVIKTIGEDIVYATPYFAKTYGFQDAILDSLTSEYFSEKDTELLEIGQRYILDYEPEIFKEYKTANNFLNQCKLAIVNNNLPLLKKQNSSSNINSLNKFVELKDRFQGELLSAFNENITQNRKNESLINYFDEAIKISPNVGELKYQSAMFITDLCIAKLNDNLMELERGVELLIKAVNLSPSTAKVSKNLAIVTQMCCSEMLRDNITKNGRKLLDKIISLKKESRLLNQCLINEVGGMFEGVMNQLKKDNYQLYVLIEKKINLPAGFPDFDSLSGPSLNIQGLALCNNLKKIKELSSENSLLSSFLGF